MELIEQTYPRYESYKASGSERLDAIPCHWGLEKLGPLLRPVSIKNRPDLPLLSITREQGVIVRDVGNQESNHNYIPDDLSGYKVIKPGQFGMNKMKAWQGSYGISQHHGIVSPAYFVFDFTRDVVPEFFHIAIRSRFYVSLFASASDGVRIGQWDLSKPRMKAIPFLVPPPHEQGAIARFVAEKSKQIDRAIASKREQIDLLEERKQVVVQNAVLRGVRTVHASDLRKDAIFGDVPKHWKRLANKYLFKLKKGRVGKNANKYELLSLTLRGVIKRDMDNPEGKFPAEFDSYQPVEPGDFVFCLFDVEETPRTVGISPYHGMITGAYTVMSLNEKVNAEYIHYLYYFLDKHKMLRSLYRGLRNTIPKESFFSLKTLIPPRGEQDEIVEHLDRELGKIEGAASLIASSIEQLRDYRAALIDDAVTGKIKVA